MLLTVVANVPEQVLLNVVANVPEQVLLTVVANWPGIYCLENIVL